MVKLAWCLLVLKALGSQEKGILHRFQGPKEYLVPVPELMVATIFSVIPVTVAHGGNDTGPCLSTLCQNGGTCIPHGSEFRCDCNDGYSGSFCQDDHTVKRYVVSQGDNVKILCKRPLTPTVTSVLWYKTVNGTTTYLNISGDAKKFADGTVAKPSLQIYLLDFDDEGEYACQTMNDNGETVWSYMAVVIEGVILQCNALSMNSVQIEYVGAAQQVVFSGDGDKRECSFTPTDDQKDRFDLTVPLHNNDGTGNNTCTLTRDSDIHTIYVGRVKVRMFMERFDTPKDKHFDIRCYYTMIANGNHTSTSEPPKVSAPTVMAQPSGPKSQSSYTVGLRTHKDLPLSSPRAGDFVIFKAVMTPAPGDTAFTVSNCEVFSDDKKKRLQILVQGCGTGWPIKKTDGFIMKGTEAFSPVFKLFQIKKKSKLNISCNFFVCKDSCDGSTCK